MALAPSIKPFVFSTEELAAVVGELEATRQKALERYHALREGTVHGEEKPKGRGRPPLSLEAKINKLLLVELARATKEAEADQREVHNISIN